MVPNIYRTVKVSFNSLRLNNYSCFFPIYTTSSFDNEINLDKITDN